ncbi:GGDEF domain-containing protein [Myxococcota bacterium]|nr:GGDEF domain-containing protein [Myxococcota bacterium]
MFWNRGAEKPKSPAVVPRLDAPTVDLNPAVDDSIARELDRAVEALGGILRTYGQHGFDLGESTAQDLAQRAERWASHVILRTPVVDEPGVKPPSGRDWAGLRQFFRKYRQDEQAFVVKSLTDLRQIIWAFVQSLGRAVLDDGSVEHQTKIQLERLRTAVQASSIEEIKREALNVVLELDGLIELKKEQQRQRTEALATELKKLGTKLEEAEREIGLDALTQLANRKTFDSELTRSAHMFHVLRQPSCLLVVDVDHFKKVNDGYGHPVGDKVLQALAQTLVMSFPRKADCVARVGGEEFAVILRDTTLADAKRLGLRLIDNVRGMIVPIDGGQLAITVSIGVSQIGDVEPPETWFARTDRALYAAKAQGRDRLVEAAKK